MTAEAGDHMGMSAAYEASLVPVSPLEAIQDSLRVRLGRLADAGQIDPATYRELLTSGLDDTVMAFEAGLGVPLIQARSDVDAATVAMRAAPKIAAQRRSDIS